MSSHIVCRADELPPGERRIVEIAGRSIGVFNVGGTYYALRNRCPHKGAPLCRGPLRGLVTATEPYTLTVERPGEILCCPWHGWEFDITNGRSYFNPHAVRVRCYDVTVEGAGPEPAVETFPTTVEHAMVVVHLPI